MLPLPEVNLIAILVGAVLTIIFGSLWYSPLMFGKLWMEETGMREEDKKGAVNAYIGGLINSFITTFVLAVIIRWIGVDNVRDGAWIGFWVWLGFVATTQFAGVLWERKSIKVFGICASFSFITLTLLGALLAWWR